MVAKTEFRFNIVMLSLKLIVCCWLIISTPYAFAYDRGEPPETLDGSVKDYFIGPESRSLVRAIEGEDLRGIDSAISKGTNVNSSGRDGLTPLWWAIKFHRKASFQHLLECGADPNAIIKGHYSILDLASGYKDSDYLRLALKYKGDPNLPNGRDRDLPILTAISFDRQTNLMMLIRAGANLNGIRNGEPPMDAAVAVGRYDFVYWMLQANENEKTDESLRSLIHVIAIRRVGADDDAYVWRERVLVLLRKRGFAVKKPESGEGRRTKPLPPDIQLGTP